jgi:hypothetical protein
MSAPHIDLADAVTASLTTLASGAYTPVRSYLPTWTDRTLADLECVVVPSNVESEIHDRSTEAETHTIDVGFAKRLSLKTREELDALSVIVDAAFRHLRPAGASNAFTIGGVRYRAVRAEYKAIFNPDSLAPKTEGDASGAFLSVFSVTYRALS